MADKVILTEVLEASNLTETYAEFTAHTLINELRHVRDDPSVRYYGLDDRAELGEPADQRTAQEASAKEDNTFTVDDAVEALGFGRFQVKLSLLTGIAWMADAMEMMLLSLLSPALACEWGVAPVQQALVTTCVFSGMMLSSTFWGKTCDRFGRRVWLPESARFDMACGRPEKALATLQKAAKENRVKLPDGRLAEQRGDISNLLSRDYRSTTLLLWFIWAVNAFSYYGMVLFTTVLFQSHDECHGGLFSNGTQLELCHPLTRKDYFDLLSTTMAEFPGLIITVVIIEWFGRKKTMALEFAVFSLFTFALYFCLDR
ncbi:hypothetical protein NECAME_09865 [Necator americanus]|uniref:Major facilitator superfamily (MFS) profile domain-containing protein n=1 Tax=Necator americanus TaxID=51031 RepID=W2TEE5_NECAM|nr:hypothetical protein NECAME_09865 [Necator americanus]ETN79367.1 hypothetical protein NECAME_09865 [Necator americanus]